MDDFVGHAKYMWSMATYQAIPVIRLIPDANHIDLNPRDATRNVAPDLVM